MRFEIWGLLQKWKILFRMPSILLKVHEILKVHHLGGRNDPLFHLGLYVGP